MEKKNVLLSGEIGVGKSTAANRALALLGLVPGGFRTHFDDTTAVDRRLYLRAADGSRACVAVRFAAWEPLVDEDCFNVFGAGLIRESLRAPLLLMDELGFLEARCEAFQAAVREALDAPVPVLVVLRQSTGGWLDTIRARPDVQLVPITAENRDALPETLAAMLRALLPAAE